MKRPHYGWYLLWWCGVWLLTTVPTQLPECYERAVVDAPWEHLSFFSELTQGVGFRFLMEIPFGLIWASLSWLLQWGLSAMVGRFRAPGLFQRKSFISLWTRMAVVVLLACVEALMLGVPLGNANTEWVNFSLCTDDAPPVTITNGSIRIESASIMLAFPLACLVAGYFAAGGRLPKQKDSAPAPVRQENVWPPAPVIGTEHNP